MHRGKRSRLDRRRLRGTAAPILLLVGAALLLLTAGWIAHRGREASPAVARAAATLAGAGSRIASLNLPGAAPGACVAYAPTAGNRGQTVFIDPGHGGPDPGTTGATASGTPVAEKTAALAVGTQLAGRLQADGYRVVLSRTGDSTVAALGPPDVVDGAMTASAVIKDLNERAACANAARAAVAISIHFNGFDDGDVGGAQTFYDPDRPFAAQNRRLALAIQSSLVGRLNLDDRGIGRDDELATETLTAQGSSYGHLILLGPAQPGLVDSPTQMPAVLCEVLFLSNPGEAGLAAQAPDRVAAALAAGITAYLRG